MGLDGPSVEVPGWACDWLERHTNLAAQRTSARGDDPTVDDVLVAIRHAALAWRERVTGSASALESMTSSPHGSALGSRVTAGSESNMSELLSTGDAADLIGITDSAVRIACRAGRLSARRVGQTWLITERDALKYAESARRRTG